MCEQLHGWNCILFFQPSFLWRFSEPCFDTQIPLELRIHTLQAPNGRWYLDAHYCNNPRPYFTYHTHLTDSLFGGNNYTVRYHELAGSETNTVATSLWRMQRRNRSNVFSPGRAEVDLFVCDGVAK
jgi:hypothetical protein